MTLHVVFTETGIPGWIGTDPREGAEPVEDLTVEFLAGHRRTAKGNWVARAAAKPQEPTAEALAEAQEAAWLAALADRDQALRAALAAEADPLFFRWQRDETSKEEWLEAVATVKARYPKPERV
jgi:hypothetical protein